MPNSDQCNGLCSFHDGELVTADVNCPKHGLKAMFGPAVRQAPFTSNPRSLHFAEMLDRAETFSDRERGELADLLRAMTFEGGEAETCIERLTRERDRALAALKKIATMEIPYGVSKPMPAIAFAEAQSIARAALSGEPNSAPETSRNLPGDGTRRAAFNAWWQEMWKDNDPRSSPGFDEQMRSWSLDAWQAGAAHERARISAISSAVKASGEPT